MDILFRLREPRGEEAVHATHVEGKRSQHPIGCDCIGRKANLIRLDGLQGDIASLGEQRLDLLLPLLGLERAGRVNEMAARRKKTERVVEKLCLDGGKGCDARI
jgi:hypothetical protein